MYTREENVHSIVKYSGKEFFVVLFNIDILPKLQIFEKTYEINLFLFCIHSRDIYFLPLLYSQYKMPLKSYYHLKYNVYGV